MNIKFLPVHDGTDEYHPAWKILFERWAAVNGFLEFINGEETVPVKDANTTKEDLAKIKLAHQAQCCLGLALKGKALLLFNSFPMGQVREAWVAVDELFDPQTFNALSAKMTKFSNEKLPDFSVDPTEWACNLFVQQKQINKYGITHIDSMQMMVKILTGLTPEYGQFLASLMVQMNIKCKVDPNEKKEDTEKRAKAMLENLLTHLRDFWLAAQAKGKKVKPEQIFNVGTGNNNGNNNRAFNGVCFNCEKPGHMSRDCPEPRRETHHTNGGGGNGGNGSVGNESCSYNGSKSGGGVICGYCGKKGHAEIVCRKKRADHTAAQVNNVSMAFCIREKHGDGVSAKPTKDDLLGYCQKAAVVCSPCFVGDDDGHNGHNVPAQSWADECCDDSDEDDNEYDDASWAGKGIGQGGAGIERLFSVKCADNSGSTNIQVKSCKAIWLGDSGASAHACGFIHPSMKGKAKEVKLYDGSTVESGPTGDILLDVGDGNIQALNNCLYATSSPCVSWPGKGNVLSCRSLASTLLPRMAPRLSVSSGMGIFTTCWLHRLDGW
jgi:Zinc knuckle